MIGAIAGMLAKQAAKKYGKKVAEEGAYKVAKEEGSKLLGKAGAAGATGAAAAVAGGAGREMAEDFEKAKKKKKEAMESYPEESDDRPTRGGMKKGGAVKSSASKRADGCAMRGKTKGRMV